MGWFRSRYNHIHLYSARRKILLAARNIPRAMRHAPCAPRICRPRAVSPRREAPQSQIALYMPNIGKYTANRMTTTIPASIRMMIGSSIESARAVAVSTSLS